MESFLSLLFSSLPFYSMMGAWQFLGFFFCTQAAGVLCCYKGFCLYFLSFLLHIHIYIIDSLKRDAYICASVYPLFPLHVSFFASSFISLWFPQTMLYVYMQLPAIFPPFLHAALIAFFIDRIFFFAFT